MPRHKRRITHPRERGPKPAPFGRLTVGFLNAIGASGYAKGVLATVASFPSLPHLSKLLYDDHVSMTPLVIKRLKNLAEIIQFKDDIFEIGHCKDLNCPDCFRIEKLQERRLSTNNEPAGDAPT